MEVAKESWFQDQWQGNHSPLRRSQKIHPLERMERRESINTGDWEKVGEKINRRKRKGTN